MAEAVAAARNDDAKLIANWLDLRSAPLRRFLDDLAGWDKLAAFVATPEAGGKWARAELDPLLADYGVDALWLATADGRVLHAGRRAGLAELALPVPAARLADLSAPSIGVRAYFHPAPPGLLEVRANRLGDRDAPWIFVARLWDSPYLERLGDLTESDASLAPPAAAGIAAALQDSKPEGVSPAPIVVQRSLPGWDGEPALSLRLLIKARIIG